MRQPRQKKKQQNEVPLSDIGDDKNLRKNPPRSTTAEKVNYNVQVLSQNNIVGEAPKKELKKNEETKMEIDSPESEPSFDPNKPYEKIIITTN